MTGSSTGTGFAEAHVLRVVAGAFAAPTGHPAGPVSRRFRPLWWRTWPRTRPPSRRSVLPRADRVVVMGWMSTCSSQRTSRLPPRARDGGEENSARRLFPMQIQPSLTVIINDGGGDSCGRRTKTATGRHSECPLRPCSLGHTRSDRRVRAPTGVRLGRCSERPTTRRTGLPRVPGFHSDFGRVLVSAPTRRVRLGRVAVALI